MFMAIVEAYQVLLNEELRQKYDNGEDVSQMARKKGQEAWNAEFHFRAEDVGDDGRLNSIRCVWLSYPHACGCTFPMLYEMVTTLQVGVMLRCATQRLTTDTFRNALLRRIR